MSAEVIAPAIAGLILGPLLLPRLWPLRRKIRNVDPATAPVPDVNGWMIGLYRGNAPAPLFLMRPEQVLEALDEIILATPRTRCLIGSLEEGRITYVTRSRIFGFADFTTVEIATKGLSAAPLVYARLHLGRSDLGVNRRRVESWMRALGATLAPA